MRFGVIANLKRPGAEAAIAQTLIWAGERGHEIILAEELKPVAPGHERFAPREHLAELADIIVSMGGDGTLLASARAVGTSERPLLGINLGSLGFLTQQQADLLIPAFEAVVAGRYEIEKRMVLQASLAGRELPSPYALNDVVVDNGSVSRVIDIGLFANGEEVVTYKADGLIIATPTGSTAYCLAVGGPIVTPTMAAMVAAPISAFSLTSRPIVFSANDVIELTVATHGGEAVLTLDGQIMLPLDDKDRITIRQADFSVHLVRFPEHSYFRVLRKKLNWGILPKA